MNESGVRVSCPNSERVIVFIEVMEVYTLSLINCKSAMVLETIRRDGKKTLLPLIISLREKIIENRFKII
jgi:hypothetical protein